MSDKNKEVMEAEVEEVMKDDTAEVVGCDDTCDGGGNVAPIKDGIRDALEGFFNYEAAQPYFQAVAAQEGYKGSDPVEIYKRLVIVNEDGEISFCNKDLPQLFERYQMLVMGRTQLLTILEPAGIDLTYTPEEDAVIVNLMLKMKSGEEVTSDEVVEAVKSLGELYTPADEAAILKIAETCHEVNRVYCKSIGDDSQAVWAEAPDWQKESAVKGVKHHIEHPDSKPSDSHESWLKEKKDTGWVYGEVKDAEKKTHPCIVPFDELSKENQTKDELFLTIVRSLT